MSKNHENTDTITVKHADSGNHESTSQGSLLQNLTSFIPIILMFLVLYFLVLRPQEKKRKQHAAMLGTVKKGEEVLLHSGIIGVISKVSDDFLDVEIADGVTVKVVKHAVADITSRKEKHVNKDDKDSKKDEKVSKNKKNEKKGSK